MSAMRIISFYSTRSAIGMLKLDENGYHKVHQFIRDIPFNTFFARVVVERKINGSIYVDDASNPTTCLFTHPYGMSLLCGKTTNSDFNRKLCEFMLNERKVNRRPQWLMVHPEKWSKQLKQLLNNKLIKYPDIQLDKDMSKEEIEARMNSLTKDHVIEWTRVNFRFNKRKYYSNIKGKVKIPDGFKIARIYKDLFQRISGRVVPEYFWNSPDHFSNDGIGFCLMNEDKIISTCFSAWIVEKNLELGIETNENFRRHGYAMYPAAALIGYCLENHYEPVWSCNKENTGSFRLAQKLGFEVKCSLPNYSLVKGNY
jgi:GNAT superfamily N-acetyltransferase